MSDSSYGKISDDGEDALRVSVSYIDDESALDTIARSELPMTGQVIGSNYTILEQIGEGAMAIVYKARQNSTGRLVAVKTLKFEDTNLAERFVREISIHSKLKHENIVEAIDCIIAGGRTYFVMELLNGISLEEFIAEKGGLQSPNQIASIMSQVCEALDFAHQQGIVHRDVKPENIFLLGGDSEFKVKVLDFGVAKIQEDLQRLTKTGVVLGSPAYMSPEQCMGLDLDERSDIYSLGVVAYEMVTAELPYNADTPMKMMESHCEPSIKPTPVSQYCPDLKAVHELEAVFAHVMETDPDKRTQAIEDFKRELNLWWRAATAGTPGLQSPFRLSGERRQSTAARKARAKAESVLNKTEEQSLHRLMEKHRGGSPQERTASLPSASRPQFRKAKMIASWLGLGAIVIGLSVFFAYLIISTLESQKTDSQKRQAQKPEARTGPRRALPPTTSPAEPKEEKATVNLQAPQEAKESEPVAKPAWPFGTAGNGNQTEAPPDDVEPALPAPGSSRRRILGP